MEISVDIFKLHFVLVKHISTTKNAGEVVTGLVALAPLFPTAGNLVFKLLHLMEAGSFYAITN